MSSDAKLTLCSGSLALLAVFGQRPGEIIIEVEDIPRERFNPKGLRVRRIGLPAPKVPLSKGLRAIGRFRQLRLEPLLNGRGFEGHHRRHVVTLRAKAMKS